MNSHDTDQELKDDNGFRGFEPVGISCKSYQVTANSKNSAKEKCCEAEVEKDDGADSTHVAVIKEATSNSSCDSNFLIHNNKVKDSNGLVDCDIKVNLPQESVDISEPKNIEDSESDDPKSVTNVNTTSQISNTSSNCSPISCNSSDADCISPSAKKLRNVQSLSNSVTDVLERVNNLDIVENSNNTSVSSVILKNNNSSLRNLLMYHSESSDSDDNEDFEANWQTHVFPSTSSSSDSESDSQECVEISDDEENVEFVLPNNKNQSKKVTKPQFESMDISQPLDLSNIQIDYDKEQFVHIGHITNFINATVTIDTLENTDSYNMETILFVDDQTSKKPLGGITDVIGPVSRPVYCVQLQDVKDIENLGLKEGMKVYSAPKSSYTKYVFLKDLLKMKGTDASWIGDEEQPSDEDDSSEDVDDEESTSRKRSHNSSLERHKQFEKAKNRSNIIKSQVAVMMDRCRIRPRTQNIHMFPHGFDPRVPPPNFQQNSQSVGSSVTQYAPQYRRFLSQWSEPTMRNSQRRFPPHPHQQHNQHNRPQQDRTNYFANNLAFNHNSPGPSRQNHY